MTDTPQIYLLDHKVKLLQSNTGFKSSMDSVLLAAACPATKKQTILELGCGVGGAAFCLLYREKELRYAGIDIDEGYIELARLNADLNQVAGQCSISMSSVTEYRCDTAQLRFEHVICNPPYYEAGKHIPSPEEHLAKARGHVDEDISLKDWIDCAFHNLQPRGSFTIIHQAEKLDAILRDMGKRFGAVEVFPIYTKEGRAAKRVVVRGYKDRLSPLAIRQAIYLEDKDGKPTEHANLLLREGMSFDTLLKDK